MLDMNSLKIQFIADNIDPNIEIELFKIRERKKELISKIDNEMRMPEFERREIQLLTAKEENVLKRKGELLVRIEKEWSDLAKNGFKEEKYRERY